MTRKRMKLPWRPLAAALAAALTLRSVALLSTSTGFGAAVETLKNETLPLTLLRHTLGDEAKTLPLSFDTALTLSFSPILAAAKGEVAALWVEAPPAEEVEKPVEIKPETSPETLPPLSYADNGVPSHTLRPAGSEGYVISGKTYISNASSCALSGADLAGDFAAKCPEEGPQILIVHTHATESYTMPAGEEYVPSDEYRTLEEDKNMLRIGDEIAAVLERCGLGVVHDRTLHDYPNYSGAYNRSSKTIERYLEEYPSLLYVLDVHRDAVEDESGRSYKLLCAEQPHAAQMEFVLGTDGGGLSHETWAENLKLACAVQETILADYPTLMRPIVLRNSRYNQQLTPGSLLIEVGTAGNSLDEALTSARIFAEGFAETVLK